jgi:mannose-6-phosphate isomerase-like protein (cupin superfamily)
MKKSNLKDMINGWFVGAFTPNVFYSKDFEVAIKSYIKNQEENIHHHKIASEITVILKGRVKINDIVYKKNDIILIEPNESVKFIALTNVVTIVVKTPSCIGDKYENL